MGIAHGAAPIEEEINEVNISVNVYKTFTAGVALGASVNNNHTIITKVIHASLSIIHFHLLFFRMSPV